MEEEEEANGGWGVCHPQADWHHDQIQSLWMQVVVSHPLDQKPDEGIMRILFQIKRYHPCW